MTTEQTLLAEFNQFFQEGKKEAELKVLNVLNLETVSKLKETVLKAKYTIEDVTPEGYGN
jgi:hypothetical protein